jgi:hypothetical protein
MTHGSRNNMLAVAVRAAVVGVVACSPTLAGTTQWQTTGTGNSQDWFLPTNWTAGVPGTGDTAIVQSPNTPPSNAVTFAANAGVGAIVDAVTPTTALSFGGTVQVTLFGQTVTAAGPDGSVTQAARSWPTPVISRR